VKLNVNNYDDDELLSMHSLSVTRLGLVKDDAHNREIG